MRVHGGGPGAPEDPCRSRPIGRNRSVFSGTDAVESLPAPSLEPGTDVSAETSKRLSCDASLFAVVEGANGEPLAIGRRSRTVPAPMRRALHLRDNGCRFPGCTQRHFVDAHHIQHWSEGGETCLDNLVLLCRHHHRLVHELGFACERSTAGDVVFRDVHGRVIPDAAPLDAVDPDQIERLNHDHGIDVSAETCSHVRDGVPGDLSMIVSLLIRHTTGSWDWPRRAASG